MNSFAAVIDLWPSHQALADDAGVPKGTVAVWKHRNSIPAERWSRIVSGAAGRGIVGVDLEMLAMLAASTVSPTAEHEARVQAAGRVA